MNFLDLIWLIPLLPLCGAVLMLFFGRRFDPQAHSPHALVPGLAGAAGGTSQEVPHPPASRRLVSLLCCGTVLLSFLLSVGAVAQLAGKAERIHEVILFSWIAGLPFRLWNGSAAVFQADMGFLLDPLSAVMILVVTGVGFLIHVYSIGYMAHDGGYYRFFGFLNLFVFFMLMLVLANNYVLLFVGWEGVGLCSYLLIGFYFHKKSAGDAGNKAFLVNRVGDAAFILGMLLMFAVLGSVRFTDVNSLLAGGKFAAETAGFGALSVMALLLFAGATGKSAQFPLHVWLPDAMEGPTPVSALIHAATMVTAGVYMVARSSALYALTPLASEIVLGIGGVTAILAASIALVQNDIKRVLAYSTVSQLGFMVMALGAGAYWTAIFHLYTHAFFKALLFLGSGSVIHAMSGEQDMRKMGGLKDKLPVTFKTMLVGSLAISGIPGLAGFFSKDEILWQVFSSPQGSKAVFAIGLLTAAMTAFYMFRLMYMTFYGSPRADAHTLAHIHESPPVMTLPLVILAAGSVLAGWIGVPKLWAVFPDGFRAFEHWLQPLFAAAVVQEDGHASHAVEWLLMLLSVGAAVAGILLARRLYAAGRSDEPLERLPQPLYRALANKWYLDDIYDFLFVNGLAKGGGSLMAAFDRRFVDGGVNAAGLLTRVTSVISIWWDSWIVDGLVRLSAAAVRALSYPLRMVQSGYVQAYALVFMAGVALLFGYYLLR
jgi:NADH-quinone oxidoreductase subunit L